MSFINIKVIGLKPHEILMVLYNAAKVIDPNKANGKMTNMQAREILCSGFTLFDKLMGKDLGCINLAGEVVDTWLYNLINGENIAEESIKKYLLERDG